MGINTHQVLCLDLVQPYQKQQWTLNKLLLLLLPTRLKVDKITVPSESRVASFQTATPLSTGTSMPIFLTQCLGSSLELLLFHDLITVFYLIDEFISINKKFVSLLCKERLELWDAIIQN